MISEEKKRELNKLAEQSEILANFEVTLGDQINTDGFEALKAGSDALEEKLDAEVEEAVTEIMYEVAPMVGRTIDSLLDFLTKKYNGIPLDSASIGMSDYESKKADLVKQMSKILLLEVTCIYD